MSKIFFILKIKTRNIEYKNYIYIITLFIIKKKNQTNKKKKFHYFNFMLTFNKYKKLFKF